MSKIDLKKEQKQLYRPSKSDFEILEIPPMNFLMIEGAGDPNTSPAYQDAVQALYSVSYTLKFMSKRQDGIDYVVLPLEGLWYGEEMKEFDPLDKDSWLWTAMIRQPDHVTEAMVTAAIEEVRRKKDPPALPKLRFQPFHEGLCAQILHIGPYDAEAPLIARMHEFIRSQSYSLSGKHHEIYLSDPNRVPPERLRTILRQPIRKD